MKSTQKSKRIRNDFNPRTDEGALFGGRDFMASIRFTPEMFRHREYPTCRCGIRFVPIRGSELCFRCGFTER